MRVLYEALHQASTANSLISQYPDTWSPQSTANTELFEVNLNTLEARPLVQAVQAAGATVVKACTLRSAFCILHSALCTLYSALCTLRSAHHDINIRTVALVYTNMQRDSDGCNPLQCSLLALCISNWAAVLLHIAAGVCRLCYACLFPRFRDTADAHMIYAHVCTGAPHSEQEAVECICAQSSMHARALDP